MPASLVLTVLLAAAPLHPGASPARWGGLGHRVVALLAWEALTPAARAAADRLLEGTRPGDAAVWADQIKSERRETAALHYVNIPLGNSSYDGGVCAEGRCIVDAIVTYRATLADAGRPSADRAEALRFLLHLVGDLHQPLHVSDRGDRGGNLVEVRWRNRTVNLHALWDTDLLQAWALDEGRYLQRLRGEVRRLPPAARDSLAAGTPVDWALEGNAIAARVVYPDVAGPVSDPAYLRRAGRVMDQAMVRAALRLARILNEALDPSVNGR